MCIYVCVYIYDLILISHKNYKIMTFAPTQIDLEIVILSEVREEYHMKTESFSFSYVFVTFFMGQYMCLHYLVISKIEADGQDALENRSSNHVTPKRSSDFPRFRGEASAVIREFVRRYIRKKPRRFSPRLSRVPSGI